jgi:hypothetical protein
MILQDPARDLEVEADPLRIPTPWSRKARRTSIGTRSSAEERRRVLEAPPPSRQNLTAAKAATAQQPKNNTGRERALVTGQTAIEDPVDLRDGNLSMPAIHLHRAALQQALARMQEALTTGANLSAPTVHLHRPVLSRRVKTQALTTVVVDNHREAATEQKSTALTGLTPAVPAQSLLPTSNHAHVRALKTNLRATREEKLQEAATRPKNTAQAGPTPITLAPDLLTTSIPTQTTAPKFHATKNVHPQALRSPHPHPPL